MFLIEVHQVLDLVSAHFRIVDRVDELGVELDRVSVLVRHHGVHRHIAHLLAQERKQLSAIPCERVVQRAERGVDEVGQVASAEFEVVVVLARVDRDEPGHGPEIRERISVELRPEVLDIGQGHLDVVVDLTVVGVLDLALGHLDSGLHARRAVDRRHARDPQGIGVDRLSLPTERAPTRRDDQHQPHQQCYPAFGHQATPLKYASVRLAHPNVF
ncbi:Uncharacterised protein [Mycobacteroides abscessus subsp. massiliense]|nr:Uncharacterised protein [Mycobacteroides abscessus subsp. massiliense]